MELSGVASDGVEQKCQLEDTDKYVMTFGAYYYHCGCGTFSRMHVKYLCHVPWPRTSLVRFAI